MENSINTRSSFRLIPWLLNCIFTINWKNIGLLYLLFCFISGIILIKIFNKINVDANIFIILNNWKFDDILLIKFIILIILYVLFPILFCGFNNILIPLMLKCELMFPRMNNISFWVFCLSFLIMLESVLCEVNSEIYKFYLFPFDTFLSNWEYLFIFSLYLYSFSLFLQSINYICTIIKTKQKLSIFVFTTLSISLFLIFYLPVLTLIIGSMLLKNSYSYCFFSLFFEKNFLISLNFKLYWFLFYPIIWILIVISWGVLGFKF